MSDENSPPEQPGQSDGKPVTPGADDARAYLSDAASQRIVAAPRGSAGSRPAAAIRSSDPGQTREGGRFAWANGLGLDIRLGFRMLRKYPMLTIVGGIAITVATAIGLGASEFVRDMISPELPLEEGDRIVRISYIDAEAGGPAPASLYDMGVWREELSSLENIGAVAMQEQGVISDRGESGTVSLARMSAAGFDLTRIPPLMGRYLLEADERPEAPPVVVLGYDAWQTLLAGDPNPIGRTIQLAGAPTEVVGVMPEGYGFPEMQNAWVPFRIEPADLQPEGARRAAMFARLAPGATLESAQAELETVSRSIAADNPEQYQRLTPRVSPFADRATAGQMALILSGVRVLLMFFLAIACANVATLVFARTVMREGEIAVRMSLGATRRRIVLQLFAEGFVLVLCSTLIGMFIAWFALGRITRLFFTIQQEPRPPFWWNDALSPTTIIYAVVLAVVGAVMIGAVPALKATGGEVKPRLGKLSANGGGGLKFGGMWTVVIVLQVALSVAFLPVAVSEADGAFGDMVSSDFPAEEYVTAQLGRDPAAPPRTPEERAAFMEQSRQLFDEVRNRLAADPAVEGVAFASGLSAMNHIISGYEIIGDGAAAPTLVGARMLLVDQAYLELVGATPVAGQPLGPSDFNAQSRSVVVNEDFVEEYFAGRNPVGVHLRVPVREGEAGIVAVPESGASLQIIGVVSNPGIDEFGPGSHPAVYAPLDLAPVTPRASGMVGMPQEPVTQIFVKRRADAGALAPVVYETVASVDPTLRLSQMGTAAEAWGAVHTGGRLGAWILMGVAGIILMLSIAGIFALMSFIVTRRTREIAIRSAVGAPRGRILKSVFGRAALQLMAGVALGSFVAVPVLMDGVADDGPQTLIIVSTLLLAAGMVACLIPVRRALRIQPAAAMKAE